ncbi:g4180 [Coccomyxa viridis]|uniref:G4180 protein n=1 Tax=Coccomyxa viridis TaxID=1274662 RepID=A0ABP1FTQ0_9CHLO
MSRAATAPGFILSDAAQPEDLNTATAPHISSEIPAPTDSAKGAPTDSAKGPLPEDTTHSQPAAPAESTAVPTTPQQHIQPAAPARLSSAAGGSDTEGPLPPTSAIDILPAANRASVATNATPITDTNGAPMALEAKVVSNEIPTAGGNSVLTADTASVAAADIVPIANRASVAINGADSERAAAVGRNGPNSPRAAQGQALLQVPTQAMPPVQHGPGSHLVAPGQPSAPAAAPGMPLPVYLQLAAYQIRALEGTISQQQDGWIRQLNSVEKQALLLTACQVLSQACDAAADQVVALAGQLESSHSNLTINLAAVQLLDPATFSGVTSPWEFGDLWFRMGPVVTGLLAQLPPSNNTTQNSAILAAEGLATAGDTFKDLLTLANPIDTTSLAALKLAALKKMNEKDLTSEDKDMLALKALADKANAYAKMNWRYYQAYTGWGTLLTWLKLLTALAITVISGKAASTSDPYHWLATAIAALGGLHTLLVTIETRWPPKALAKPFMIAQKQYQRLIRDIGDPTQALLAQAALVKQDADPDLDVDPFTDVGLTRDGTPALGEGKQVQIFLDIGMALNTFDWFFSLVEKEVPPPKDLPLWRLPPQT